MITQKDKNKNIGMILLVFYVLIAGSEVVLQKLLLNEDIHPDSISSYRMIFVIVLLTIMILFEKIFNKNKEDSIYKKDMKIIKDNKLKYYIPMLFMGICKALDYFFFVYGLQLTKVATTISFINHIVTSLLIIILLAIFIPKERKNLNNIYTIISIPIAFLGILFTNEIFNKGFNILSFDIGTIYVLISTIFWAIYILIYTKYGINVSTIRIIRDAELISFIVYFIGLIFTNRVCQTLLISPIAIISILVFTFIVDLGHILTYYKAIKLVSGIVTTLFGLSSPAISFILCYLLLHERISMMELIGCILLFIANILLSVKEIKEINKKNKEIKKE